MKKATLCIGFSSFVVAASTSQGQVQDSVYFRNLAFHSNGSLCTHRPTATSFVAYLNNRSRIVLETSPRWNIVAEPNIPGNGSFGVELANFVLPGPRIGDSALIVFTCTATGEQGVVADSISSIPWFRFPVSLSLAVRAIPSAPQNLTLSRDTIMQRRIIAWDTNAGERYSVYRRLVGDTISVGRERMLYSRLADNIPAGTITDSTALANRRYGYVVTATSAQGVMSPHSVEVNENPVVPAGDDLAIGYIGRVPRLNYVWASPQPDRDGWPQPGQTVWWQANVKNWTARNLQNVQFKWMIDGVAADSGSVSIPARDTVSVLLPWTWTFVRHTITFIIDPADLVPEEEELNNSLTIFTNAIGVGLYVERSVYDYFKQYQRNLPNAHSNCWEDWAQRQVRRWNQMFANAIYPESPNGVLDCIRLDKIAIVPDNALPLHGGLPTNNPNLRDSTIDLQWGFPVSLLSGTFYSNHTSTSDNNPFYYEGSLLHELGHARYLVDVYGFNVEGGMDAVAILEGGQPVAGSVYMPYVGGTTVYLTAINGLMNSQYTFVDRYSAVPLNLIAGHRATFGNCNAPDNIGAFLQDLPQQNRLTVKDQNGSVLAGASVWVYQSSGRPNVWYGKYYDNTPDLQLTTDANGEVLLGRCPFSSSGIVQHDYGISNVVIILRVAHGGRIGYGFLECSSFNFEFWRGNRTLGTYELRTNMLQPSAVEEIADQVPMEFRLDQNFPNPFNPTTRIEYAIPRTAHVSLKVFDLLGREVGTLVDEVQGSGFKSVEFNAPDLANGVYFYRLRAGEFVETKKLILTK